MCEATSLTFVLAHPSSFYYYHYLSVNVVVNQNLSRVW